MRLRGREINIFSMSALDLFASGMGAFILLAIMALPFFPNTGSSPVPPESGEEPDEIVRQELDEALEIARQERDEARQRAEALAEALEQATQERDRSRQQAEDLQSRVTELEVPDFDLVICLDVTGSMTEQVDGLKLQINNLARILNAIAPTGLGIVAFGDRDWGRSDFRSERHDEHGRAREFRERAGAEHGAWIGRQRRQRGSARDGAGKRRGDELAVGKRAPVRGRHIGLRRVPGAPSRRAANSPGFFRRRRSPRVGGHGERPGHRQGT